MSKKEYLLEIDGLRFKGKGKRWNELTSRHQLASDNDIYVISDFANASNLRQTRSAQKYAESVLLRDLREGGEVIGNGRVISHHKRKITRDSTELFYTIASADDVDRYATAESLSSGHFLLFGFHRLLYKALMKAAPNKPVAIMIAHGRFVDLIVGTKHQIYDVRQVLSYEDTQGLGLAHVNISSLEEQIRSVERTSDIVVSRLIGYSWLEDEKGDDWLKQLGQAMGVKTKASHQIKVSIGKESYKSSLVPLLDTLDASDSVAESAVKNRYRMSRMLPWVAILILVANGLMGAYFLFLHQQKADLNNQIATLSNTIKKETPIIKAIEVPYKQSLNVALELEAARATPSYATVLKEVTLATGDAGSIVFDRVVLDYPSITGDMPEGGLVTIELVGDVEKALGSSLDVFKTFVERLTEKGYRLINSKVQSDVTALHFTLNLERQVSES